jgi:hypothetical protein
MHRWWLGLQQFDDKADDIFVSAPGRCNTICHASSRLFTAAIPRMPLPGHSHQPCTPKEEPDVNEFSARPEDPALGRPPLLPPEPHQPDAALHQRHQLPVRLRAAVHQPGGRRLIGWVVSMGTRQSGHFFFEPQGFDHVNNATNEHKEAIKVGYNLQAQGGADRRLGAGPMLLWLARPCSAWSSRRWVGTAYLHDVGILAGAGVGGLLVPHRAAVLHPRRADRPGLDDQDPDRPLP